MSSKSAVAGNFLVSGVGQAVAVLVGFGTISVLTRYLGDDGYGTYLTAFVFLMTIAGAANLGIPTALLHMMGQGDVDEERLVGGVLGLRILIGLVMLGVAPALVLVFGYEAEANELVLFGAVGFFFIYLSGAITPVFQKHLAMTRAAGAVIADRVIVLGLALGCVSLDLGARAIIVCVGISAALIFVVHLVLARPLVRIRPRYDPEVWKTVVHKGWPMATMTILGLLCLQGDMLLLARYRDSAEVGVYGLPNRVLALIVGNVPMLFMALMLPQLSRSWRAQDHGTFRDYLQTTFDFFALALIPVTIGTLVCADGIVLFIGGDDFAGSADVLRVRVLGVIALFFSVFYRYVGMAVERQERMIAPMVVVTALTLGAYLVFIPSDGMWGAAWTRVLQALIAAAVSFGAVLPVIRHVPRLGVATKALVAGGVMYGVMAIVPDQHVLFDLTLGCVVYGLAVLATGAVRIRDLRNTLATLRRNGGGTDAAQIDS